MTNDPHNPVFRQLKAAQEQAANLAAEIAEYAELKRLIASCHFDTSDPVAVVRSIIEGNMKDRAELDRLRQAIVAKGGDEHSPTEWAYEQACKSLHSKHAELEAARKERDAVEKLKEMAHSAAVTWQQRAETYHEAVQRTEAERDTALAAKDAAEKRVAELEAALKVADDRLHLICGTAMAIANGESEKEFWKAIDEMGPDMTVVRNALTPAPTQEPPAGGVTISNDSSLPQAGNNAETKEGIVPSPSDGLNAIARQKVLFPRDDREQVGQATPDVRPVPAVTISTEKKGEQHGPSERLVEQAPPIVNSPADVPSAGRGEWMPIETAPKDGNDLLLHDAGETTRGFWSLGLKRWIDATDPHGEWTFKPTHWQPLPPPPMLPTEGSGA